MAILAIGLVLATASALLEILNPQGYWLLFEDISLGVAPTTATIAVAVAAARGDPEHRALRTWLAVSLGLAAAGQLVADIPDLFPGLRSFRAVSDVCNVLAAILGISTLLTVLYRRLDGRSRLPIVLDGQVIMAAAVTFVIAGWLQQSLLPGLRVTDLIVPLVSALFLASAGAAVVAALWLRVEPSRRGVWAVTAGIVLMALAWDGWIGRFLSGGPDGIEPMDFIFPAGSLLAGYGAVTWSLAKGGGERYERLARATSDWVPIVAIAGCAILDVVPHSRPQGVDPIAVGTCVVVMLAVARQLVLQGRERVASQRLTAEMTERAAMTGALGRLEALPNVEERADRVCSEALGIDGVDTVVLYVFSPIGAVPLARAGVACQPVEVGNPIPDAHGCELLERADSGPWLESWKGRLPRDDFDGATIAAGLRTEALAPLVWNDTLIGLLSMGATSDANACRLSERLGALAEFAVISAAILGPMLTERWERDLLQAEIQWVIASGAFTPVFQPIFHLATRKVVGYEALTRFSDGTRPDLRFLAADKVGMMVQLEMTCLHTQVEQARRLPQGSFVSLNVSPALAICLTPLLDVVAAADHAVVLEITEHAAIEDYPRLRAALDGVRPVAMLAVDDAGAGYAGLHHILELRPQYVKLDISLVRDIDTDPARQAMVTGMASFAEIVGCALIAEGIETEGELATRRLLRVEFGQGYFLAMPAPIGTWAHATRQPGPPAARVAKSRHRKAA
jgi:EAL domain-containing protein (putative c-di-GMP-specific phosphodiesterase class I)